MNRPVYEILIFNFFFKLKFAVCLLIIFIIELAVGIAAACYHNEFDTALKDALKNSMTNYSINDSEKLAWDKIQAKLKCCGIDGPSDWQSQPIPTACCQMESEDKEAPSQHCNRNQNGAIYLSTNGCYNKLTEKAGANVKVLIGIGIGIAFVQVSLKEK